MHNQKQFGIWMDNHHAAIVGSENTEGPLTVIAHVKGEIISRIQVRKILIIMRKLFRQNSLKK